MLKRLLKMQRVDTEEEMPQAAATEGGEGASSLAGRPAWALAVLATTQNWLQLLPQASPGTDKKEKEKEKEEGPIERCITREHEVEWGLINVVRRDLCLVQQVCNAEQKHSNHTRSLVECITKGTLPRHWRRYVAPPSQPLNLWIVDLARRMSTLPNPSPPPSSIWLGGFFNPNAFITATRQAAARVNGWSVENMELIVHVLSPGEELATSDKSISSFVVRGKPNELFASLLVPLNILDLC